MGITITDVKIVGTCSKCRKPTDEIQTDKEGRAYTDKEISCIDCAIRVGDYTKKKKEEVEKIAAFMHYQWACWTDYMLNNFNTENVLRWKRQIKDPYENLSEKEKNSDREWAVKLLKWLRG